MSDFSKNNYYQVEVVELDDFVKDKYSDYKLLGGYAVLYSKREDGHLNWHGFKKPKKLLKILGTENFEKLIQGQRDFVIEK